MSARAMAWAPRPCEIYGACRAQLICQRCGKCVQHCTCPPPEYREQAPKPKQRRLAA